MNQEEIIKLLNLIDTNNVSFEVIYAEIFKSTFKKKYIYDEKTNKFYIMNDFGIYINDNVHKCLKHDFKSLSLSLQNINHKYIKDNYIHIKSILNELKILYVVYDLNNINNLILAFKNGVYDFKNYEFRNALSSELITNTVNYDYEKADPQIKKELYNILADIFPDFEELSYLLKTISLGLVGTNIYKEIYVWTGNQGKTIIGNLTKSVLENYLRYFDPTYFKKKCDISLHLMVHLKDTRLLFIEENFAILNVDNLKKITNDTIQARNLFVLDGFNYTSKFKPILVTNSDINLDKYDQKLVERFRFISFPNIFVKEPKLDFERKVDIDLPEKLSDKKYSLAFLEILLDNYKDLIMYGLTIPKRFEQLNKKFFNKLI